MKHIATKRLGGEIYSSDVNIHNGYPLVIYKSEYSLSPVNNQA